MSFHDRSGGSRLMLHTLSSRRLGAAAAAAPEPPDDSPPNARSAPAPAEVRVLKLLYLQAHNHDAKKKKKKKKQYSVLDCDTPQYLCCNKLICRMSARRPSGCLAKTASRCSSSMPRPCRKPQPEQ